MELRLRPIAPDDAELLFSIYASTRAEEIAQVPWSDSQQAAFLRQQFAAQDRYYREHYATERFQVVLADGAPAGRLYVERRPSELRIVDIALLPAFRGRGIGTALLRAVLAEGNADGLPVTIHVECFNPARRLYERLGFRTIKDKGVYLLMERHPATADAGSHKEVSCSSS
jgi:ribosomal protein S18 acetylase RimI-like enzyme